MSVTLYETLHGLPISMMETNLLIFDDGSSIIKTAFYNALNGKRKVLTC